MEQVTWKQRWDLYAELSTRIPTSVPTSSFSPSASPTGQPTALPTPQPTALPASDDAPPGKRRLRGNAASSDFSRDADAANAPSLAITDRRRLLTSPTVSPTPDAANSNARFNAWDLDSSNSLTIAEMKAGLTADGATSEIFAMTLTAGTQLQTSACAASFDTLLGVYERCPARASGEHPTLAQTTHYKNGPCHAITFEALKTQTYYLMLQGYAHHYSAVTNAGPSTWTASFENGTSSWPNSMAGGVNKVDGWTISNLSPTCGAGPCTPTFNRKFGSTSSSQTGPSGAYSGTYYLYAETSGSNSYGNKDYILERDFKRAVGSVTFRYWLTQGWFCWGCGESRILTGCDAECGSCILPVGV